MVRGKARKAKKYCSNEFESRSKVGFYLIVYIRNLSRSMFLGGCKARHNK